MALKLGAGQNIWIEIDRDNSSFSIKDDGDGMTSANFQGKFLKIGGVVAWIRQ